MSSPLGQYGSKGYESSESRTLGKFQSDKFSYREQAKNIIELNNAVGYMSGYMRKMQRGIDEANQNFVQQIQGLINDFLVILGGGGDTAFEFGDAKYVFQALGALFGFANEEGEIILPINLVQSAWYFFSSYIMPSANYVDAINMSIDSAIATMLDIFGEVPIVGQALEQLAVIISDLRDLLNPVAAALEEFLAAFNLSTGDIPGITDYWGPFQAIFDAFGLALDGVDLPDFSAVFHQIALWTLPFIESIAAAIGALTYIVNLVLGHEDLSKLPQVLLNIFSPLNSFNLFNLVPTDLMAHIPFSNIGEATTNLISDGDFQDDAFIEGWTHHPGGGYGGTGARSVVADGTTHEMLSNWIPVSAGQVMPVIAKAKWTGLVGTGTPVQLGITGYVQGTDSTNQVIVAQHNTSPPTTDWVDLSGTYTVPSNVYAIRVRAIVAATATAGRVYFSKMSITKTQNIFQKLIAGTDPGDTITDDITNLFSGIMINANELINKAGLAEFSELLETLAGDFGSDINAIQQRLNDFLHSASILDAGKIGTGEIADQFVPGLSTIQDALVTAIGKLSGSGFDITKVLEVLTGQTNSVVSNATGMTWLHSRLATAESRLAALPVSLGGTGVGISFGGIVGATDTDDFERVSTTSLGPLWSQYYSSGAGVWATPNGHDAEYMWSGTQDREFACIRNNPAIPRSLTDYQRVTNVLSSKGTREKQLLGNWCGHNDVWLRVSDSTTSLSNITGIRIRWGADGGLSIVRFVNGVATTLKSYPTETYPPPGPGGTLVGEAGDMNGGTPGQRYFRGLIGNSIAIEITETGVASGFGAAFRRWGHGGRVEGWTGLFDNGQERPGTVNYWNAMDQVFA